MSEAEGLGRSQSISETAVLPLNSVVCLMAPTASGKTSLAYELYDTGQYEIISVDSALIYKDMNIGTAKPSVEELHQYPHHLVNIIDPTETYNVANFVTDVEILITEIHSRGKTPLLVGGTMMYYMALFTGLSPIPNSDRRIREEVEAWRQDAGIEALHDYLCKVDPIIAERLNVADSQRVTRAVEVYKQTGKPLSYWQQLPKQALSDNKEQKWIGLAVMPDRAWLHKRIELRLNIMWEEGFYDEVKSLLNQYPLSTDMPSMRCVGYRQVIDYLILTNDPVVKNLNIMTDIEQISASNEEVMNLDGMYKDMTDKVLYATRQLAKRQYTWLRNLVAIYSADSIDKPILKDKGSLVSVHTGFQASNNKEVVQFDSIDEAKNYLISRMRT